jgi:hypothetical protein
LVADAMLNCENTPAAIAISQDAEWTSGIV